MAAVNYKIITQGLDGNNVPWSIPQWAHSSTGLLADMQLNAAAYLPVLDAITQDVIHKAELVVPITLPGGLKASAVAGTNNEVGALIRESATSPGDTFSFWYPNWIPAGFQTAHPNLVNTVDGGPVQAFLAFLIGTNNNTNYTDEDYHNLVALLNATKSTRKQRRALGRLRTIG